MNSWLDFGAIGLIVKVTILERMQISALFTNYLLNRLLDFD